jgi:hypothetical protein
MEDKDLQTEHLAPAVPESPPENQFISEPIRIPVPTAESSVEPDMSAATNGSNGAGAETTIDASGGDVPPAEPSARERLRGSVLEEKKTVSGYMRRRGIFDEYEISSAKETPFFMRVFAASALAHLVIIAVALQLPAVVETTCDSTEFTQQVCNTIYVASLLNTDRTVVDRPVTIDEFGALVDEPAPIIDEADFSYPEGYWTLRDEIEGRTAIDDIAMLDPNAGIGTSGISTPSGIIAGPNPIGPNSPASGIFDLTRKQKLPKSNPKAVKGSVNDFKLFDINGGETAATPPANTGGPLSANGKKRGISDIGPGTKSTTGNKTQATTAQPKSNKPANQAQGKSDPDVEINSDGIEINKFPLKKFASDLKKQVDGNQVDIAAPFSLTATGVLDKDGKFDVNQTNFTNINGDPRIVEVAKVAIESLNASGYLGYLKALGNKKLELQLVQDQDKIAVQIKSEVESDANASKIASGLNVLMSANKLLNKNTDTGLLLENANVTNQGNVFLLSFSLPQNIAQPLIKKKLAEVDNSANKVNSLPVDASKNSTAAKE